VGYLLAGEHMPDKIWFRNLQKHRETHELTDTEIVDIEAEAIRLNKQHKIKLSKARERAEESFWLGLLK
jgi:hypothetical protein